MTKKYILILLLINPSWSSHLYSCSDTTSIPRKDQQNIIDSVLLSQKTLLFQDLDSVLTFLSFKSTLSGAGYYDENYPCILHLMREKDSVTNFFSTFYCQGNLHDEKIPDTMYRLNLEKKFNTSINHKQHQIIISYRKDTIIILKMNKNLDSNNVQFKPESIRSSAFNTQYNYKIDSVLIDLEGYKVYALSDFDSSNIERSPHIEKNYLWISERWGLVRSKRISNYAGDLGPHGIILDAIIKYTSDNKDKYIRTENILFDTYFKELKRLY